MRDNNNDKEDIFWTLFFAIYWLIGGGCLAAAAPWPWPAYCGLGASFSAVIGFAVFKRTEDANGKGQGCLGMLLFFPPLTMAIVGKAIWFTVWLG